MDKVYLDKKSCSGCTACYSACPRQCITMVCDAEGFLYPQIDATSCVSCGVCKNVCPMLNSSPREKQEEDAFILRTKDYSTWKNSSSGGAFTEICRAFSEPETIIYGAAFDGLTVKHIAVNGINEIGRLRKSKYVASDIAGAFQNVKKSLEQGKKVVFSGTPCQVAGLKRYLKHEYENLLTVDLICHGVGSPAVFKDCMKLYEKETGNSVSKYTFRAKRLFYEEDHLSKVEFDNGKVQWLIKDRYNQLFLSQACTRPSCGDNCVFVERKRESDLTLADFKCLYKDFPEIRADRRNCSTVVCHTEKGRKLINRIAEKAMVLECPMEYVIQYNPLYCEHTYKSGKRDDFFKEFILDHEGSIRKWTIPPKKALISAKMIISKSIPASWKNWLIDIKRKGN